MRNWKQSKYQKIVRVSQSQYLFLIKTKGKKSIAGRLEEIIKVMNQQTFQTAMLQAMEHQIQALNCIIVLLEKLTEKKTNKRNTPFTPPLLEEVKAYCEERQNNISPESFVDFYKSKGWKVGGEAMKDWKAAIRTWEQRDNKGGFEKITI